MMNGLKFRDVVWSAVLAVVLGAAALIAAALGNDLAVLASGLAAIAAAVLSIRERV